MIKYKFIDFDRNIIDVVLETSLTDKTILIFPSHKSKDIATLKLQEIWDFQNIQLITMDDLADLTSLSDKARLQDAKRNLLFYLSLTPEIKTKYNIVDYFSSIKLSNLVFQQFTEMSEEDVTPKAVEDKLISQGYFADWQIEVWNDLLKIKENYRIKVSGDRYQDRIFEKLNFNTIRDYFSEYKNIVFVNQFYFTKTEKKLIKYFSGTKEVVLYYQLPEKLFDKNNLCVKDFTLKDLIQQDVASRVPTNGRLEIATTGLDVASRVPTVSLEDIHIYSAINDFSQLNKAIEVSETENINTIVDFEFYTQSWFRFLSNEKFSLPSVIEFQNTELYRYFQGLLSIFEEMKIVDGKYLIPIYVMYRNSAISRTWQAASLREGDWKSPLRNDFYKKLAQRNYLYFDPHNPEIILKETDDVYIKEYITDFSSLLIRLLKIRQMNEFIDLIDVDGGIEIKSLCRESTIDHTDILEKFYGAISNIYSIEEFGVIHSWDDVFDETPIIVPIIRFFIEYIFPTNVRYDVEVGGKVNFITLVDTRNLKHDKMIFLNVTEGILPKAKSVDFLFTEKQREIIGLKTYESIRLREKYYFFRALLTTRQCHIFYLENEEDDMEKSSFVEELEIYLSDNIKFHQCLDRGYIEYFSRSRSDVQDLIPLCRGVTDCGRGVTLPSDFEKDFAKPNALKLTPYSLFELFKDPFKWFIESNLSFNKIAYPEIDRLNHKNIGIFAHKIIERLYRKLSLKGDVKLGDFRTEIRGSSLDSVLHELAYEHEMKTPPSHSIEGNSMYKYPHDFSGKYFEEILFPYYKKRLIYEFHDSVMIGTLNDNCLIKMEFMLPESLFLETDDYKVYLSGKPDMVIYDECGTDNYIIDFKTGDGNIGQLVIYEWLLKQTESRSFKNLMINVFKTEDKADKKYDSVEKIKDELVNVLDKCKDIGYYCPSNKADRDKYKDVSRVDKRGLL